MIKRIMENALHLTHIAFIAVAATFMGMLMVRLKQPAAIGYIIVGALLGSFNLFIEGGVERQYIFYMAQIGVILLLYFIGMELSVRNLHKIWRISLVTLLGQIFFSFVISLSLSHFFQWNTETVILFGFCLALSSTAVAVKTLESYGEIASHIGKLTIGILIAQDLAVAPMLLIITGMQTDTIGADTIGLLPIIKIIFEVSLSIAILCGVIYLLTRRRTLNLPFYKVWVGKQELTSLWALSFCFLLATLCGFLNLTPAFGAFLAGLIVGNSAQRRQIHRHSAPIQSVLLMVFFLSVGLLVDFGYIFAHIGLLLILWLFVMVFKTLLNSLLLKLQGETWANSFRCSLILGQMGEFSFVLAGAALAAEAIDQEFHKMIVALTVISLVSTPLYIDAARRLGHRATRHLSNPGQLLRLIYAPEWRLTRRWVGYLSGHKPSDDASQKPKKHKRGWLKALRAKAFLRLLRRRLPLPMREKIDKFRVFEK